MTIKSVQRRHKVNRYSKSAIAGDAVGITHFILANILLVVGEFTELLRVIDVKHAGIRFIYDYLDAPVYYFLEFYIGNTHADGIYMFLAVELVIVTASVVYTLITYAVLKILGAILL
jgi:hypothetical protein